ncbi:uncharacterized protein [Procambarus clarkii]|uniref:uncharacterized protein isoform X1 n=1 Tax=Procambarus clarkii TaxID=6728 RepID=UPI003742075B
MSGPCLHSCQWRRRRGHGGACLHLVLASVSFSRQVRSGRHRGRVQPVTEVSLVLLLVLMALLHFSTAQYWHDRGYQPVYGQGYYQDNYGYRPTYGHGYQQYYDDGLYGRHRFRY